MSNRTHSWNAYETTLDADLSANSTEGNISVVNVGNIRDESYLVIDPEDMSLREYIKVVNVNVGPNVFENCERGLGGSAGGIAVAHKAGATVRAVAVHQWLDDIFDDIEDAEFWRSAHDDGSDWHPRYLDRTGPGSAEGLYVKLNTPAVDGPQVLSGPINLVGTLDMGKPSGNPNKIVNVGAPDEDNDAATKLYVDEAGEAIIVEMGKTHLSLADGGIVEGGLEFRGGLVLSIGTIPEITGASRNLVQDPVSGAIGYVADGSGLYLELAGGIVDGDLRVNGEFVATNGTTSLSVRKNGVNIHGRVNFHGNVHFDHSTTPDDPAIWLNMDSNHKTGIYGASHGHTVSFAAWGDRVMTMRSPGNAYDQRSQVSGGGILELRGDSMVSGVRNAPYVISGLGGGVTFKVTAKALAWLAKYHN